MNCNGLTYGFVWKGTLVYIIIIIIIIIISSSSSSSSSSSIILGISFMQGIYTYIPEKKHVPKEHRVAATPVLLFMVRISLVPALTPLYLYVSTSRCMCAVPNMAVFCSSLTSWFPGMLLTYFLNDFEVVPVAPIITGITFVFTFHISLLLLLLSSLLLLKLCLSRIFEVYRVQNSVTSCYRNGRRSCNV